MTAWRASCIDILDLLQADMDIVIEKSVELLDRTGKFIIFGPNANNQFNKLVSNLSMFWQAKTKQNK